eukprot:SAG11_NODE_38359_length_252_cov_1.660131_1_plen_60_part_01
MSAAVLLNTLLERPERVTIARSCCLCSLDCHLDAQLPTDRDPALLWQEASSTSTEQLAVH